VRTGEKMVRGEGRVGDTRAMVAGGRKVQGPEL